MNEPQPLFDLTPTDEQRMNRDTMQRFAAAEMRSQAKIADEANTTPEDFYARTAALGLALLPIPEALGGAGMSHSPTSNALIMEDLAHGDLGLALGALSPMAFVNTLLDQGTDAQREMYLPRFCNEEFVAATTALLEPRATFEPTQLATRATANSDGFTLSGTKTMVDHGPAAFLIEGTPQGMQREPESHMGLRTLQLATLVFEEVQVPATALLGGGDFNLRRFLDLSRIGICALAVGNCQAILDYVTPYVNEREAFGEPISHRQSVAFMVADIATELEAMRLMTWRAASGAEQGLDFHQQAYLAKLFCAEHAMKIATDGVQLLGGHGFCREHPVEMWYRNLRAIAILDGVASV
jgi:alkylation response protein AidB-like acyl-CoA dehydrogenase